MDAISFTENLLDISSESFAFGKCFTDAYSIRLIREHHDSCFHYIHYETCESSFADVPFTVVF